MPKLGFAPVQTQGIFDIRVKANEEILKTLEKAKLIEKDPEDGHYYLRKKGAWRKRLQKILDENGWDFYPSIDRFITWVFYSKEETEQRKLEKFLRELDEYIEQIRDILEEDIEVEV